jgi:hypothetical protein
MGSHGCVRAAAGGFTDNFQTSSQMRTPPPCLPGALPLNVGEKLPMRQLGIVAADHSVVGLSSSVMMEPGGLEALGDGGAERWGKRVARVFTEVTSEMGENRYLNLDPDPQATDVTGVSKRH